jgi:hypothetical protein
MPINFNNSSISRVVVNGTRMERVFVNGTQVLQELGPSVTLVASNSSSFNPGEEDENRHFVVVQGRFSSNALGGGPIPAINGTTCTTIMNIVDNSYDDGGRAGIFTIKIPTGTTTFTVSGTDERFVVYRVTGITSMTSAFATAFTPGGGGTITVGSPSSGCGFVVAMRNFNNVGSISGTNADLTVVNVNPGIGANRAVTSPTHTFGGSTHTNIAATFAYNVT